MASRPLVYDVGMHNGDDSAYYLAKGFEVVGIDADASVCGACEVRFRREIAERRMTILNVGVAREAGMRMFHLNIADHALSSFQEPEIPDDGWEIINLPVRTLSSIILERESPFFVKIDVEHYDYLVLLDLMSHGLVPPYISAESHSLQVFCALVCMGYEKFKLAEGYGMPNRYGHHRIGLLDGGSTPYGFTKHSSGPFGEDLPGEWMDRDAMFEMLAARGMGWFDIHATTIAS